MNPPLVLVVLATPLLSVGPFALLLGGVTARKIGWGVLGFALLGVAALCILVCAAGYEAGYTGLNPRPWWKTFGILVITLTEGIFSGAKLLSREPSSCGSPCLEAGADRPARR